MSEQYIIKTGQVAEIPVGLVSILRLFYSGMPNKETFALTPILDGALFYEGTYSPVIYYKIASKKIHITKYQYQVIRVSSDEIVLEKV